MKSVIAFYSNIQDLTGVGEEWLLVDNVVVAKFLNGNIDYPPSPNQDKTVEAA